MNIEKIKSIIVDQEEEIKRIFREERIIQREFLPKWANLMEGKLIKVVTGVRRTGKSIFCLQLLNDRKYAYINFDDERLIGLEAPELNSVLQAFYELFGEFEFIFLDEVQNIEGWELFVNRLKRLGFNLLITGSNAKLLSRELATHLTGRYIPIEIFPFSFREFLIWEKVKLTPKVYSTKQRSLLIRKFREHLKIGGFPEAVKDRASAKSFLSTLYSSILTKDVVGRYGIRYVRTLKEISNYLISNFSQRTTFNKIKNIFDLKSAHTAKNYVSYIEEAYLISLVHKFSFKPKEIPASPKKVYAVDLGLVNLLSMQASQDIGRVMENVVAIELFRKRALNPALELYYWRNQKYEVDFVVRDRTRIKQLIQVTYASAKDEIKRREIRGLVKASEELKCKDLLVITWDYEDKDKEINYVPLWKWLLEK